MFAKYLLPLVLLACGSCRTGATVELQPACGACRSGATVELQPILHQHQLAMRQLMNSYSISGRAARPAAALTGAEVDACFDYYSTAQNSVATKYNNEYMGCVNTAAEAKSVLSAQSAEQRADIVTSGTDICSQLNECQKDEDSLDFFKCTYSVTDSTLSGWYNISVQSDAIVNHLKVQYQKIDDDQAICTTAAKNEYVSDLATVASNLNKCLIGEFVPPVGEVTTQAPVTDAPVTDAPITDAPVTDAPVTEDTTATAPEEVTTISPDLPEEDVWRFRPMTRMNMWNMMRRL